MYWMQALVIIGSIIGSVVVLGFLFRKSIDRSDRNFEILTKDMKAFQNFMQDFMIETYGRLCVLEKKKKKE